MDSVWQITGVDQRSGEAVQSQLLAESEAEARSMAAAIHIQVSAIRRVQSPVAAVKGSAPMRCPHCGAVDVPRSRYQGSRGVSSLLFLLFFPAALLYELWRHVAKQWVCPRCGRAGMVPPGSSGAD